MSFEDDEYWDEEYSDHSAKSQATAAPERNQARRGPESLMPTRRPSDNSAPGHVDELAARRQRRAVDGASPRPPAAFDSARPSWLDDPDFVPVDTSVPNLAGSEFADIDFNRPELGADFDAPDLSFDRPAARRRPDDPYEAFPDDIDEPYDHRIYHNGRPADEDDEGWVDGAPARPAGGQRPRQSRPGAPGQPPMPRPGQGVPPPGQAPKRPGQAAGPRPGPDQFRTPPADQGRRARPEQFRDPQPEQFRRPQPEQFRRPQPEQFRGPQPEQFRGPQPEQFRGPQPEQGAGRSASARPGQAAGPRPGQGGQAPVQPGQAPGRPGSRPRPGQVPGPSARPGQVPVRPGQAAARAAQAPGRPGQAPVQPPQMPAPPGRSAGPRPDQAAGPRPEQPGARGTATPRETARFAEPAASGRARVPQPDQDPYRRRDQARPDDLDRGARPGEPYERPTGPGRNTDPRLELPAQTDGPIRRRIDSDQRPASRVSGLEDTDTRMTRPAETDPRMRRPIDSDVRAAGPDITDARMTRPAEVPLAPNVPATPGAGETDTRMRRPAARGDGYDDSAVAAAQADGQHRAAPEVVSGRPQRPVDQAYADSGRRDDAAPAAAGPPVTGERRDPEPAGDADGPRVIHRATPPIAPRVISKATPPSVPRVVKKAEPTATPRPVGTTAPTPPARVITSPPARPAATTGPGASAPVVPAATTSPPIPVRPASPAPGSVRPASPADGGVPVPDSGRDPSSRPGDDVAPPGTGRTMPPAPGHPQIYQDPPGYRQAPPDHRQNGPTSPAPRTEAPIRPAADAGPMAPGPAAGVPAQPLAREATTGWEPLTSLEPTAGASERPAPGSDAVDETRRNRPTSPAPGGVPRRPMARPGLPPAGPHPHQPSPAPRQRGEVPWPADATGPGRPVDDHPVRPPAEAGYAGFGAAPDPMPAPRPRRAPRTAHVTLSEGDGPWSMEPDSAPPAALPQTGLGRPISPVAGETHPTREPGHRPAPEFAPLRAESRFGNQHLPGAPASALPAPGRSWIPERPSPTTGGPAAPTSATPAPRPGWIPEHPGRTAGTPVTPASAPTADRPASDHSWAPHQTSYTTAAPTTGGPVPSRGWAPDQAGYVPGDGWAPEQPAYAADTPAEPGSDERAPDREWAVHQAGQTAEATVAPTSAGPAFENWDADYPVDSAHTPVPDGNLGPADSDQTSESGPAADGASADAADRFGPPGTPSADDWSPDGPGYGHPAEPSSDYEWTAGRHGDQVEPWPASAAGPAQHATTPSASATGATPAPATPHADGHRADGQRPGDTVARRHSFAGEADTADAGEMPGGAHHEAGIDASGSSEQDRLTVPGRRGPVDDRPAEGTGHSGPDDGPIADGGADTVRVGAHAAPYMDPDGTLHNLRPIARLAVSGPDDEPRRVVEPDFVGQWFAAKSGPEDRPPTTDQATTDQTNTDQAITGLPAGNRVPLVGTRGEQPTGTGSEMTPASADTAPAHAGWMAETDTNRPADAAPTHAAWMPETDTNRPADAAPTHAAWMPETDTNRPADAAPTHAAWMPETDTNRPADAAPADAAWMLGTDAGRPADETPADGSAPGGHRPADPRPEDDADGHLVIDLDVTDLFGAMARADQHATTGAPEAPRSWSPVHLGDQHDAIPPTTAPVSAVPGHGGSGRLPTTGTDPEADAVRAEVGQRMVVLSRTPDPEPAEPAPAPAPPGGRLETLSAADLEAIRWRLDGGTLREIVDNQDALRELGERLDSPLADEADDVVKAGLLSVRAEVYRLLGELGMAAAASRLALAHAESSRDVQSTVIAQAELAHVLRLRGDFVEADRLFTRAAAAAVPEPLRSVVHENAGRSCFDQGRHMEALDHFARAVRLGRPDDTDLAARIGVCLQAVYIHVLRDGWGPYPRNRQNAPRVTAPTEREAAATDRPIIHRR